MLGIITIVAGCIGWLLIVDFPDKANFLTEEERKHGELRSFPISSLKLSAVQSFVVWTATVAMVNMTPLRRKRSFRT